MLARTVFVQDKLGQIVEEVHPGKNKTFAILFVCPDFIPSANFWHFNRPSNTFSILAGEQRCHLGCGRVSHQLNEVPPTHHVVEIVNIILLHSMNFEH